MMNEHESDYNSSDDEDYVPDDEEEDVDYPSGDEVDGVTNADAEVLTTKRKRRNKDKLSETSAEKSLLNSAENEGEDDAEAAFMALMAEEDPILGKKRSEAAQNSPVSTKLCESLETIASSSSSTTLVQSESKPETTLITEVYDFAGDEIRVEREVTSEEAQEIEAKEKRKENGKLKKPGQKRLSLGGALTLLAKKPKMSILDKSNLDWMSYKTENNLQEELETFNRGKNGYLDRMEFLSRTDYKQFEKEKEIRNASRKPL